LGHSTQPTRARYCGLDRPSTGDTVGVHYQVRHIVGRLLIVDHIGFSRVPHSVRVALANARIVAPGNLETIRAWTLVGWSEFEVVPDSVPAENIAYKTVSRANDHVASRTVDDRSSTTLDVGRSREMRDRKRKNAN